MKSVIMLLVFIVCSLGYAGSGDDAANNMISPTKALWKQQKIHLKV